MQDAFAQTAHQAGQVMQEQITQENRVYPDRITKRKEGVGVTGKIAHNPRDVVDTGELRDSFVQSENYLPSRVICRTEWTADHAQFIFYGTNKQPAYNWIKQGLRRFDMEKQFKANLKK